MELIVELNAKLMAKLQFPVFVALAMMGIYHSIQVKVILTVMKQLKQLQRKPRKKFWGSKGFQIHDLYNAGAMLYQL